MVFVLFPELYIKSYVCINIYIQLRLICGCNNEKGLEFWVFMTNISHHFVDKFPTEFVGSSSVNVSLVINCLFIRMNVHLSHTSDDDITTSDPIIHRNVYTSIYTFKRLCTEECFRNCSQILSMNRVLSQM